MIDETIKALAQGKNFAAFTTLFPDGHPQTQMMWVDADENYVLINTDKHRAKFKNVQNDPRVTVTIIDATNSYHYVEGRGKVVDIVDGPPARAHIDQLSQCYADKDYYNPIQSERVILKISAEQIQIK